MCKVRLLPSSKHFRVIPKYMSVRPCVYVRPCSSNRPSVRLRVHPPTSVPALRPPYPHPCVSRPCVPARPRHPIHAPSIRPRLCQSLVTHSVRAPGRPRTWPSAHLAVRAHGRLTVRVSDRLSARAAIRPPGRPPVARARMRPSVRPYACL